MLTPQALERAPQAYRRGYYDGFYGRPDMSKEDYPINSFPFCDYRNGYAAGANDARWSKR